MRFSLFAVATALFGGALASNVVDLDPDNFDTLIGKGKPALVEL
jgi:protein disulfide-isomerase A6